jgi:hypothetical protein
MPWMLPAGNHEVDDLRAIGVGAARALSRRTTAVGGQLLGEVVRRHGPGVTLLAFRDVPWNGPWYARHGFAELPEPAWGPELRGHWQAEIDAGLHGLGPRLVMHSPGPAA